MKRSILMVSIIIAAQAVNTAHAAQTIKINQGPRAKTTIDFHHMIENGRQAREAKTQSFDESLNSVSGRIVTKDSQEYNRFTKSVQTDELADVSIQKPRSKTIRDLVREL